MRLPRIKAEGPAFYHCVSRVVEGRFIFQTTAGGSVEAEHFVGLMRRLEAFSGVRVLTYGLMSNHFHLLCQVPQGEPLSELELLERIEAGYGRQRRVALERQLARLGEPAQGASQSQQLLEPYRRRMYDLSSFFKELKGRFAQWYNRRHERYGVLWAERFKSVLLEGGQAVAAVAAYIELNPVRAGLCADPKDYRYCGYAEALARGSVVAQEGIRTLLAEPATLCWKEVSRRYRHYLFLKGSGGSPSKGAAFELARAPQVVIQQQGQLSLAERLRCRIRYFSEGLILGSQGFVEAHFQRLQQKLAFKRPRPPKPLRTLGSTELWVFRDLRA